QLIAEIGSQAADIARTQGELTAMKKATESMKAVTPAQRAAAEKEWKEANPGLEPAKMDITQQMYQTLYDQALKDTGLGTGGAWQQGISAATAAVQGLAGGNVKAALAGGSAPYLAEVIHHQTMTRDAKGKDVVNVQANLIAHAVLGAVVAQASGNNALSGASGAVAGEYIAQQLYPGVSRDKLTEAQRQTISALGTLAAGLAGGLAGDSTGSAVAGAQAGKNAVENNWLSVQEADRKKQLETKRDYLKQELTPAETKELADINQADKARNKAIKSICTDGNKGGAACGALVGPAQEALKKYGENVSYSLIYKDLYPQDAANLENVLKGVDAGSISRDQAITAIAASTHRDWNDVAKDYDSAMQTQAIAVALAGMKGFSSVESQGKNVSREVKSSTSSSTKPSSETYFRVEGGGSGTQTSQNRINVNSDGSVTINSGCSGQLCVSTNGPNHAAYYLTNRRQDGTVVVFEVDAKLHKQIMDTAVPQRPIPGVPKDPNAPKIVDPTKGQPSVSLELPKVWDELIEKNSSNARILTKEGFLNEFGK
uniref:VENN motif pre-toxin domain-containing protein n=1 Tax=Pantoea sp. IMH TaxID=1267600 RepID=UPI001378701B